MKILRWLLLLFVGSVVVLGILVPVAVRFELSYRPTYDQSDPNYPRYLKEFERVRVQLAQLDASDQVSIDLAQLNNGEWKTACLFGGYANPLSKMQALGANINE
jgi:hypothetical protein